MIDYDSIGTLNPEKVEKLAKKILEDRIYPLSRTAYYIVQTAHNLSLGYDDIEKISLDEIFPQTNSRYKITLRSKEGELLYYIENIPKDKLIPLFFLNSRKSINFRNCLLLIGCIIILEGFTLEQGTRRVNGFSRNSKFVNKLHAI